MGKIASFNRILFLKNSMCVPVYISWKCSFVTNLAILSLHFSVPPLGWVMPELWAINRAPTVKHRHWPDHSFQHKHINFQHSTSTTETVWWKRWEGKRKEVTQPSSPLYNLIAVYHITSFTSFEKPPDWEKCLWKVIFFYVLKKNLKTNKQTHKTNTPPH